MKKMKKLLAMLMAVAMLIVCVACGGGSNGGNDTPNTPSGSAPADGDNSGMKEWMIGTNVWGTGPPVLEDMNSASLYAIEAFGCKAMGASDDFSSDNTIANIQKFIGAGCNALNIYNCAAAVAALTAFGLSVKDAFGAVGHFKHGFGRGEVFELGDVKVRLMLMKNPAGCNQIINLLLNEPDKEMGLCALLNDQDCDGTDVSWIYDASWEAIAAKKDAAVIGGERAEDMALRLKYAGMPAAGISVEKDYDKLIDRLAAAGHDTTVVANYSSMMEFRKHIAARLGLAGFWEG